MQGCRPRRLNACLFCLTTLLLAPGAMAGPPFQTGDPEPVELGHYEFYVFGASDGTPIETDPLGPGFEFNWGVLPNTQLHSGCTGLYWTWGGKSGEGGKPETGGAPDGAVWSQAGRLAMGGMQ